MYELNVMDFENELESWSQFGKLATANKFILLELGLPIEKKYGGDI